LNIYKLLTKIARNVEERNVGTFLF
jgi:hypothetical protein